MQIFEEINNILADWNPIGVDSHISDDEYKGYIPMIINAAKDREQLMNCLINLVTIKMGLTYELTNIDHWYELKHVCDKIMAVYDKG